MTKDFQRYNSVGVEREDDSANGHGTKVASKIAGHFGTAKDVTIVPVRYYDGDADDITEAFDLVSRTLQRMKVNNQQDYLKSVSRTIVVV
jgi:subtilisin family serine protease